MDEQAMIREIENLSLTLKVQQLEARVSVYESVTKTLPTLVHVLGVGDEEQRERALRLLSSLTDSLETFWRDTDTDPRARQEKDGSE